MKLIFSPIAEDRLREIQAYVAFNGGLNSALRVMLRIRQSAQMLTDFPLLGPVWDGSSTRMLLVSGLPYRIHYRLLEDAVEIITVAHTSQNPPRFQ